MTPKGDAMDKSKHIISEIESNLDSELRKRRERIERELEERLRREREESERQLSRIEDEFSRERGVLREYQSAVHEFEAARESLENQLRERLDKIVEYQKEIERLTGHTRAELDQVQTLSGQLADLRDMTEVRVAELENRLKEKFGMSSLPSADEAVERTAPIESPSRMEETAELEILPPSESGEVVVNLEQELGKLKRIKELLEKDSAAAAVPSARSGGAANAVAETVPAPESLPETETPSWPELAPAETASSKSEFKMPEISQFVRDFVQHEQKRAAEIPAAESVRPQTEEKITAAEEVSFQEIFDILEKYRRSEPTDYNGEISFFQNRDHIVLDGESLLRAMALIVAEARKLYQKLGHAGSPKDQFFIKQELINNQEILRKVILRCVRMCEREGCRLPRFTSDILGAGVLKDLLERLNMDNWSNEVDFAAFETTAGKLKDDFYRRITPPVQYLRSIVQELEG